MVNFHLLRQLDKRGCYSKASKSFDASRIRCYNAVFGAANKTVIKTSRIEDLFFAGALIPILWIIWNLEKSV